MCGVGEHRMGEPPRSTLFAEQERDFPSCPEYETGKKERDAKGIFRKLSVWFHYVKSLYCNIFKVNLRVNIYIMLQGFSN